jgi:serine/threonine protein kinase
MAKIFKIWNEKLEVFRAIKIMLPSQQHEFMQRFETEAKITAKLNHPNIVEIHNVGDYSGLPYLEMEFIDGRALDAIINSTGALPPAVCTAVGIFISRALMYAHGQEFLLYGTSYNGVIHRDMKPANIMISNKGKVKLMDFGIARPTETSLHTVDGNIVGTMQYLSPEQLDAHDIDWRTDIYSFGAILYEMLSGAKTFPQKTITNLLKNKSTNEYRKLSDLPSPPPQSLAKIADKCLEHKKEDRYHDAAELLGALEKTHEQFTNDPPEKVMAEFVAAPEEYSRNHAFKSRRRFMLPVLTGTAAVLAITLVVLILYLTRPDTGQNKAAQQAERRQPEQKTSEPEVRNTVNQENTQSIPANQPEKTYPSAENSDRYPGAVNTEPREQTYPAPVRQQKKPASQPVPEQMSLPVPQPQSIRTAPAAAVSNKKTVLADLAHKYDAEEPLEIVRKALDKENTTDAFSALDLMSSEDREQTEAKICLLEAYLRAGRLNEARNLAGKITSDDAQFYILLGRMEERNGNDEKGLGYYQSALTKPSTTRNIQAVRKDALYYAALLYEKKYRAMPTQETRMQALNGWNVLKKAYSSNPDHPRFLTANIKLAAIH